MFLISSVLTWPTVLGRMLSLQWRVVDLANGRYHVAASLSIALAGLALVALLGRHRINAWYRRTFPSPGHLLGVLGLIVGSATLTLGCAEFVLEKLGLPFSSAWMPSLSELAKYDPEVGWVYIPSRTAVEPYGTDRRQVSMSFDSIGARVANLDVHHDATTPTVLLVGCSITMGHGLPWDETFAGRLETDLPWQVVNLGVQGYGTDQSLLLTKRHMGDFNTKVVVYTYIDDHVSRNDNVDRRLLFHTKFYGTKPLYAVTPDGGIVLKNAPYRFQDVWESSIGSYLRLAWTRWGPVPDTNLTRALVRGLRREVEARGATFVMVRWPFSTVRFDDPGMRVIDLGAIAPPEFATWRIRGDNHPDARADAFVAKVLADTIRSILDTPAGRPASESR